MKYRKKRPQSQGASPRKVARRKSSHAKTEPFTLPAVWPDRSRSDESQRRQIAARLDRQGRRDIALKVYCCAPKDDALGAYPCNKPLCCGYCAAVAGFMERRDRSARALLALEANPNLAFYYMTLTTHDSVDFEPQIRALKKRMKKLLRRRKGAWSKVRGLEWWIEPARGANGKWRSHIHAVVAFDERDIPRSPRCLILKWAHDHRAELSAPWSRNRWESDRKYRAFIDHQDIKPLYCYTPSKLSSRVDSSCNPVFRLLDVMEVAEYSRRDRRLESSNPDVRTVPLSADDRVHIALLGLRLRGCTGAFFGVDDAARRSLVKQLTVIDRPSLRRQLRTAAFQHPSKAASLIPTPETGNRHTEGIEEPVSGAPRTVSTMEAVNESAGNPQPALFRQPYGQRPLRRWSVPVTDCHWQKPPRQSGFRGIREGPFGDHENELFMPIPTRPTRALERSR